MGQRPTPVTADALHGEHPPFACELVGGQVIEVSPAGIPHGIVVGLVIAALSRHAAEHGAGLVTSGETGFRVGRDPDTVRAPDVAYLTWATLARGEAAASTYFPGAPDLAVEVVSPRDRWEQVEAKAHDYLGAGGRLVWVFDPASQSVHVFTPGAYTVLGADDSLDGADVLSGFAVPVVSLFRLPGSRPPRVPDRRV